MQLAGEELDFNYLQQLGTDAVPAMVSAYQDPGLPAKAKEVLGSALACRTATFTTADYTPVPWQGFTISGYRAEKLLKEKAALWSSYKVFESPDWGDSILIGGEEFTCMGYQPMD